MPRLLASSVIATVLVLSALLAYSKFYDSPVVQDGPVYPEAEQLQTVPITNKPPSRAESAPKKKNCFAEAARVKKESQQYRSCSDADECQYMPHGYVSMLAVNKTYAPKIARMYAELDQYCDKRPSHDAFYSENGIERLCKNQKCTMTDVSTEPTLEELTRDTWEAIRAN